MVSLLFFIQRLNNTHFTRHFYGCMTIFSLLLIMSMNAYAASLTASVDKKNLALNEVFTLKVTADFNVNGDSIDFSVLNKTFITSRPQFSSTHRSINNVSSQKNEWLLSLAASESGNITIPSFEINGIQSEPIYLFVADADSLPEDQERVSIVSQLSRTQLYPHESAIFSVQLFIRANPRRLQDLTISEPSAESMKIEAITPAQQQIKVIDGIETIVIEQKFKLTALNAGQFTLIEPEFNATLVEGSNYQYARFTQLRTEPKTYSIQVANIPTSFDAAWLPTSHLQLSDEFRTQQGETITQGNIELNVGDSLTRHIHLIVNDLAAEYVPDLQLIYPEHISVYSEKPQFSTDQQGRTHLNWTQVLIPRQSGEWALPNIELAWWNSQTQQKAIAQSLAPRLRVLPNSENLIPTPATNAIPATINPTSPWHLIALAVSVLWLLTLAVHLRLLWRLNTENKQRQAQLHQQAEHFFKQLTYANPIVINHAVQQWKASQTLDAAQHQQLERALTHFNRTFYAQQPLIIEQANARKQLIALIKRLNQSAKTKTFPLEPL